MSLLAKKLVFIVTLAFINDLTNCEDVINYAGSIGEELELICTKKGETFDKVEWTHNGVSINVNQFKMDPETQNLKFVVSEETSYAYSCTKIKGDKREELKFQVSAMGDAECHIPDSMEANKEYDIKILIQSEGNQPNPHLRVEDETLTSVGTNDDLSGLEANYKFIAKPKYDGKKMEATFELYDLEKTCSKTLNIKHAPDNLELKVKQTEDKWYSIICSSNGNPHPQMTIQSEKGVLAKGVSSSLTYKLEKDANLKNLTFTCSSQNKLSSSLLEKTKHFQINDKKAAGNAASSQWCFGVMSLLVLIIGYMLQ